MRQEGRLTLFTLIISLLCHFSLLLWSAYYYLPLLPQSEPPGYFIPAYTQAPPAPPSPTVSDSPAEQKNENIIDDVSKQDEGLATSSKKQASNQAAPEPQEEKQTYEIADQPVEIPKTDEEPLHLIGKSKIIKPLVKILARALQHHLRYPRSAADFHLTGEVLVGFTLHPSGLVTDAKVVKSSGAGVLDDAAKAAVMEMSPVAKVKPYVPKAEYMVVGIVFG